MMPPSAHPLPQEAPSAPPDAVPNRFFTKLLLLFIASLSVCVLAWLAWALPGAWFSSAPTKIWSSQNIAPTRGTLLNVESGRAHFAPEANGLAVLSVNDLFPARHYPVLDWEISGLPEGTAAKLLWRSDLTPRVLREAPLEIENGRLLPVLLARESNWIGNIPGIAIALQLPSPQPFTVVNFRAHPMDAPEMLKLRIKEWSSFDGWRGTSFFKLEEPGTTSLPLWVIAALALLLLCALLVLLWRRWRDRLLDFPRTMPRYWLYGGMVFFCMGWMVLDARWTVQLIQQAAQTWQTYGGKDSTQKRLAAEDGVLFDFIGKARAELPEHPVRIFIMSEAAYFRSRAAYHLYPNNVFYDIHSNHPPDATFFRPGDYLLVFQQRGIQYDAAKKMIRLPSGAELSVNAKVIASGSALFELTP